MLRARAVHPFNYLTCRRTETREQDVYGCQCSISGVWYGGLFGSGPADSQGLCSSPPSVTAIDNDHRTGRSVLIVLPSRLPRPSQSVPFARRLHSRFIVLFGPKVISYRASIWRPVLPGLLTLNRQLFGEDEDASGEDELSEALQRGENG